MSSNTLFANLASPTRELVVSLADEESHPGVLGRSDAEKKEVSSWIAKTSDVNFVSRSSLPVRSQAFCWSVLGLSRKFRRQSIPI